MRDSRYDILFEPVKIGPVTARNRFFQVPHCNGMGYRDPTALATMRGIKAEGGWGVVCTEQVEFHHTSEITPFVELRLWDEDDIPPLARMADAVHRYGSLAGIELCYNGMNGPNFYSREVPMGPSHLPIATFTPDPLQARRMDRQDLANLRRWHHDAVKRALSAGFDIIYVYAAHGFGFLNHFLSKRTNSRDDDYGGSLENRARLMREIIEDTRQAVGDRAAVAVRLSVDEMLGEEGIHRAEVEQLFAMIGELPDLWDLTLGDWQTDSRTSRFAEEGAQEDAVRGFKALTSKPIVGVGRFTSPDTMVRQVKQGILDFIGAARPSIADPFLPNKIAEGRLDDIRECIGCNICVSGDFTASPIRCTQNPTMGEEWRRGWHPDRIAAKASDQRLLVVGAGPAGLECARALGQRGYEVALAEAGDDLGGRVVREARLPGLGAWIRVRDHRVLQLQKMSNVALYRASPLTAGDILSFGFPHVVLATGATWRRDGVARYHTQPLALEGAEILSPDDLMAGLRPKAQQVLLYDDDHYYMGGVLAELLAREGYQVTLLTPGTAASEWTRHTMELAFIQRRLLEAGVKIETARALVSAKAGQAVTRCIYTGREEQSALGALVLVTARLPREQLNLELTARQESWADSGLLSVTTIGDALAPATIAHAVYAGRKFAETFDLPPDMGDCLPFRRESIALASL